MRAGKDGRPITDGVFPESKEFLAGYWIIHVDSDERALQIAADASTAPGVPVKTPTAARSNICGSKCARSSAATLTWSDAEPDMTVNVFLVTRSHGPGWDGSRNLEEQREWQEHAEFMEALARDGVVILGGVLLDTLDALLVVRASSKADVEARLAGDPWVRSEILRTTGLQEWQVRLGSLQH